MLGSILRDARTAARALVKAPAFSGVVILTLAVAIGANTAIYSIVDGILLRPLPYPEADRLVTVSIGTLPEVGDGRDAPFSDRGYWHFLENNRAFESFGGYSEGSVEWPLTGQGPPLQLNVAPMTASTFQLIGTAPQRGRFPAPEEDVPGGAEVALLSDALWTGVFGSDPSVIGRTIELNGSAREVIGVMPPGYDFPSPEIDIWIPYQLDRASENFGGHHIAGLARLAPGATVAAAEADAESLIARFDEVGYGPTWFTGVFSGEAIVRTLKDELVGDARRPLLILLGTVGFVLLIACSNVANLFLARAEARTRETGIRLALGSGRVRLVQFVLTESILLGVAGGALGVLLAHVATRALVASAPPVLPRLAEIGVSGPVLFFAAAISILAGLLFGLLPALRTGSARMLLSLRVGGRGGMIGRAQHTARNALVVSQVALALILLVGSALMVRSFQELRAVDPGFDAEGVLTFRLSPPPNRYGDPESLARFYDELMDRIAAVPGVTAAGAINTLPLTGGGAILTTVIDDFPPAEGEFPPTFLIRRATPGYFEAMGIPVPEGRAFTRDDHDLRLGSLVISESIKNQYWPEETALGKRIVPAGTPGRVVGVVGDVHDTALEVPAEQFVYLPMLDSVAGGVRAMTLTIRSDTDPLALIPALRGVVEGLDPDLPLAEVRPMDSVLGASVSRTSFTMTLLLLAAGIALLLGSVGIYGVISYTVSQRTGEIGVRLALGADGSSVRRLLLAQGMQLALTGILLGLGGALATGRVISSLLFGVSPYDAGALAGGSVIFLAAAAIACLIPSTRAAAVPPALALRAD